MSNNQSVQKKRFVQILSDPGRGYPSVDILVQQPQQVKLHKEIDTWKQQKMLNQITDVCKI